MLRQVLARVKGVRKGSIITLRFQDVYVEESAIVGFYLKTWGWDAIDTIRDIFSTCGIELKSHETHYLRWPRRAVFSGIVEYDFEGMKKLSDYM